MVHSQCDTVQKNIGPGLDSLFFTVIISYFFLIPDANIIAKTPFFLLGSYLINKYLHNILDN